MLGQTAGPPPGWKTRTHRRYISKDRALLKQLENAIKGNDQARKLALLPFSTSFLRIFVQDWKRLWLLDVTFALVQRKSLPQWPDISILLFLLHPKSSASVWHRDSPSPLFRPLHLMVSSHLLLPHHHCRLRYPNHRSRRP